MMEISKLIGLLAPVFLGAGPILLGVAVCPEEHRVLGNLGSVLLGLGLATVAIRLDQLVDMARRQSV